MTSSKIPILRKGDLYNSFPWTLHKLLEETETSGNQSIVSWTSNGNAFKVHRRNEFMKKILPGCFRLTMYKSFVRQLNLWDFQRETYGENAGACKY